MSTWNEKLAEIQKKRNARNETGNLLYHDRTAIEKIDQELDRIREQHAGTNAQKERELLQAKASLEQQYERRRKQLQSHVNDLQDTIAGIYTDEHPRKAVSELNDSIPFLLFPVRIETRFMTDLAQPQLWLRVYPDDITIHTHERFLTAAELTNGEAYWKNVFEAEKTGGASKDETIKAAWSALVARFGAGRSAWIARQTKPLNWEDRAHINDAADLKFPEQETSTTGWTQAPHTNVLPDKFVVLLYKSGRVREVVGKPIPDTLQVGPDPMNPEASFVTEDNKLVFGEDFNWTSNFDKAVSIGMGIRIDLNADEVRSGFDKVMVIGLMLSMNEDDSRKEVESLISNHHYSPAGFSIVRQGTATNNTEQDGSGYTTSDPFHEAGYEETGDPLFEEEHEKDGRYLADALGIAYEPLQFVENADATDRHDAVAMNTALYPSTLGYYFDTLLAPAMNETDQDRLRDFFTTYVSGRGPLPAIRVGNQPYGVLLTSDLSKWSWSRTERKFNLSFLTGMQTILKYYDDIWKSLIDQLVYAGKPGIDPEQALMNILGLHPGSVEFYSRVAFSTDDLLNRDAFETGGRYFSDVKKSFTSKDILLNFLTAHGGAITDPSGKLKVPQLLRLIFQHYHTTLDSVKLVDKVPLSENKLVTNISDAFSKNYLQWLAEIANVEQLESQEFGAGVTPPAALLYMQLRRSLLLQLHKSSLEWLKNKGHIVDQTTHPLNFYNIRSQPTLTKWEVMKAKIALVDPQHTDKQISIGDHLLGEKTSSNSETGFLKKQQAAIAELAKLSTGALERCFTEHLDCCSYRLDAWHTAMFTLRLEHVRKNTEGRQDRKTGVYCGCYGYVEDLQPELRRRVVNEQDRRRIHTLSNQQLYEYADNGGFVHAPSINHATAAAILRAGYLSHADASNPGMFAVNLSSERIRRASFILEGIRNGQRLEVLLGYQFERGLHDRASADPDLARLNEHIYAFRDVYRIPQHFIQQQGTTATETMEAMNVVNGLQLAETKSAYPYGVAIPPPPDAAHDPRAAIEAEKNRLEDSLDAIKDLLLSESVYQLAHGNVDRAGAILNAMQEGNQPPEIEVIRTPHSSNLTFTNRVTLHFKDADPSENPWDPVLMTEKALMEPGVNVWLGNIIGSPASIACILSQKVGDADINPITITIDKLHLQPIDLIYTSAEEIQSRLARIYRQMAGIGEDTTVSIDHHTMRSKLPLLESLRSTFNSGRTLTAADFLPPSMTTTETAYTEPGELEGRQTLAKNAFDTRLDSLKGIPITIDGVSTTLEQAFITLDTSGDDFSAMNFVFTNSAQLIELLTRVAEFGLADSYPILSSANDQTTKATLLNQAANVARNMKKASKESGDLMASAATTTSADKKTALFTEAAKRLFGTAFTVFPKFKYHNAADIQLSDNNRSQLLNHAIMQLGMPLPADEWLESMSHVRPKVQSWEQIRSYVELNSIASVNIQPVQVPYRANDSWLAVEFPTEYSPGKPFTIDRDTLSIVAHGPSAFDVTEFQSGLLIDDFTQVIPTREEMTGISFNYDQPSAMAPQALLLAVTPELNGRWQWDDIIGIVNDTFLRAKLRAVEPSLLDKLNNPQTGILLPALLASFSKYDLDFALDYRLNLKYYQDNAPVLNAKSVIIQ